MDLSEFLLARIAEDEAADDRHTVECGVGLGYWATGECVCGYPARVLAECEAKRRIVELVPNMAADWEDRDYILQVLAVPYSDHPDYRANREEWSYMLRASGLVS